MFSSRSFLVSGCNPFKSLIHSELIFVYNAKIGSSFILLHMSELFSQHHLLKRSSFPSVHSWLFHCKLTAHINVSFFLGCLFCSIDLCICFCADTILF